MIVHVIEAYSYDPEDIQGVFTTKVLAEAWLQEHKWFRCPQPFASPNGNGCCPSTDHWHDPEDWKKALITEHEVQS